MDFISLAAVDRLGAVAVLSIVAVLVITDKLVWHKRLERAVERAERWEKIALDALSIGARSGVRAAETVVDVVSGFPDPAKKTEDE